MKVVIIGGGFCGTFCARNLEKDFETVLIDNQDYFEFISAVPRVLFKQKDISRIRVKHAHYLKKTQLVLGKAEGIERDGVVVKTGKGRKKISYDFLIIAAGSHYSVPFKTGNAVTASRSKDLRLYAKRLENAKNILIIGGGSVGVEIAGELVTRTDKHVTLVHMSDRLLEREPSNVGDYAREFLEKRGCQIVLEEKIVDIADKNSFFTESGKKLRTDLAFLCTGIQPNTNRFRFYDPSRINERGFLIVDPFLKVDERIYAGGDIISLSEEKTAQTARAHAQLIVENIRREARGEKPLPYEHRESVLLISLGARHGIFSSKKLVFGGIIPALLKWLVEKAIVFEYKTGIRLI